MNGLLKIKRSLLVLAVLGAGCDSAAPPRAAARPVAPSAKPPAIEIPAPVAAETYSYSPLGKRDPFRSPLDDLIISQEVGSQCPLCKWELDQLKLVAVITGTGNPVAMLEDPDGVGHVVRQGTQVGRRNGKVSTVGRQEVVIAEVGHDPFGKAISNKTVLKIAHSPSENPQATSLLDE